MGVGKESKADLGGRGFLLRIEPGRVSVGGEGGCLNLLLEAETTKLTAFQNFSECIRSFSPKDFPFERE